MNLRTFRVLTACALLLAATWRLGAQAPVPSPAAGGPAPDAGRGGQPPGAPGGGPGRAGGRGAEPDFSPRPPVLPLTPAEQAARFWLPPGYRMEPVLAEPHIEEPGQIAFDGNGRMYVVELRGYMQDKDATGILAPVGRVSVHDDHDNDGVYETHGVFVDNMIFPRFVTPLGGNAILTKESNAEEVWLYTDTNGDLQADRKELFATGLGRLLNVEHQESGFIWALDNWIYSTINPVRIRWTPNGVLREPTGSNQSQWGVTQDNYGKLWFQNGGAGMPGYFQLPVAYGNFTYPEQFEPNLAITWGAPVLIADMQGGMNAVRMPDGSLNRATSGAGNDIFRGDRLPSDLVGDYFHGEPVGRIVRRFRPVKNEGLTQLRNAHPLQEFIRSTDPLFRPVDMTTAPDGTMYITDMYRGIIQEAQWSGPGTYVRNKIEQYQLDKVVRHGRIWRLTYEGMPRRTERPRMLQETPAQLVRHLEDPNGWWRDTAQQLLVLKQDKSVVPALAAMASGSTNQLGRIHALWTLEGLGSASPSLIRAMMRDTDSQIRMQAIRVSETLYKAGDRSFAADYATMTTDADGEVVMQALMTMNTLKVPRATERAKELAGAAHKGIALVASTIATPPARPTRETATTAMESIAPFTETEIALLDRGEAVYREVCFSCHGEDGLGLSAESGSGPARAPAVAASPRVIGHPDYVINTLLYGLQGPIAGTDYSEVMVPMGQNNDEWIAAVASYVRNGFGNRASTVSPAEVAAVRREQANRQTMWRSDELLASLPRQLVKGSDWKVSASHNNAVASYALTMQPWHTGGPQQPGMWLELALPQPTQLVEVRFESRPVEAANVISEPGAPTRTTAPAAGGGQFARRDAPAPQPGFPRGYDLGVSDDGKIWRTVATGHSTDVNTVIRFAPVQARFVRITLTAGGADLPPWSVQSLRLFERGSASSTSR
jgi:mono/diheme cytochrome c family protein/glucose/arabinose dehydrogenase